MKLIPIEHSASLVLLLASGCGLLSPTSPGDRFQADLAQYDRLQQQLDQNRSVFLDTSAGALFPSGRQLYWLTSSGASATLHRFDRADGQKLQYKFALGDNFNFRATSSLVVTAEPAGGIILYHVYDANAPDTKIADVSMPAPTDNQRWWAYDVSGGALYIVVTGPPTSLYKWVPGGGDPIVLTTLESASGAVLGEFINFGVDGNTMVYIEAGRIWRLDLAANKATWFMNKTQVTGTVEFEKDGISFVDATGLKFYRYATNELLDVSQLIRTNPYKLNNTYSMVHLFATDYTRWNSWFVYTCSGGLYAFDTDHNVVKPVLLAPRSVDLRIDYRQPVALDDGTLFVTGLTSNNGAIGVDGPTYQVDLNAAL